MKAFEDQIYCGKFKYFRPVLKEWIRIVKASSLDSGMNDCSWWYNERASLSILAGAIWKKGGFCFEEYSEYKKYRSSRYKGRCDLNFKIGKNNIILEAKQCWPNIGSRARKLKYILNKAVELAGDDIKYNKGKGRKFGVVFASPRMPYSEKSIVDERITNLIEIINELEVKCFAYTFPKEYRHLFDEEDHKYIYPGAVLLIN